MASFFVISTPIGNLGDITLRALEVLKGADLILCEDTRVTKKLLSHFNINARTESYHERSGKAKEEFILKEIASGKNIALVTDSGSPGISDPGSRLIYIIRNHFDEEIKSGELKIEAIPGPSALTAAVSIAGIPASDFTFFGFLPHKKGRETLFKEIASSKRTSIFYESPHRIMKTLESLKKFLDGTNKKVCIARELTKIHEEVLFGSPEELEAKLNENKEKQRGEFVIIVYDSV